MSFLPGTFRFIGGGISAVLMVGFALPALAQGSGILEEVLVTAQKREQSIQDVGIAITAFSGDQLQEIGIVNNTELARYSPGVYISGPGGGDQQQFTIRGATQNDFGDHSEAPNAIYVDEVYQAAQQSQLFASYDMQRVEILKGPQGTLFGRNATGGLVHFVTNKPSQEADGFLDLTYGRFDQVRVEGAASGATVGHGVGPPVRHFQQAWRDLQQQYRRGRHPSHAGSAAGLWPGTGIDTGP